MPHIPRAVCGDCNREMRPSQNAITVEMLSGESPYYKVDGDLYQCTECDATVIIGFARLVQEHWEPDYADRPADRQGRFA